MILYDATFYSCMRHQLRHLKQTKSIKKEEKSLFKLEINIFLNHNKNQFVYIKPI